MIHRCAACREPIRPGTTVALISANEDAAAQALNVSADLGPIEEARPGQYVAHIPHTSPAVDAIGRAWQERRRR